MKSFVLKELLLFSMKEEAARRMEFDPRVTVLKGDNRTGKSCLLKSIYSSLGADSGKIHRDWKKANVNSLVTIEVAGKRHHILRSGNRFVVFNEAGSAVKSFKGVTSGMGPFLSGLLDFRLQLVSKEKTLTIPPPAYMFLPFYIDQDVGWSKAWNSFANLGQFSRWQQPVAEYHTGIKPNEYYIAKGEAEQFQEEMKPHLQRSEVLKGILHDLEAKLKVADFSVDIDAYRKEVKELLVLCDELKKREEEVKDELVTLYNSKTVVESQIAIAKKALTEVQADYKFASDRLLEDHIECPACGTEYSNTFAERLAIAMDEERCSQLLLELNQDLEELDEGIAKANTKYAVISKRALRATELLNTKQGEVQLKDLIDSAGRREVQNILRCDIAIVQQEIGRVQAEIAARRDIMRRLSSRERAKEITGLFHDYLRDFFSRLGVGSIEAEGLKKVFNQPSDTGSEQPRALLAYFFSILWVMAREPGSLCPIVIDTPNQQEQDPLNKERIYSFLRDCQPEDSQMILALGDEAGVDFGGKVEELTEENHLMDRGEFKAYSKEINRLMTHIH